MAHKYHRRNKCGVQDNDDILWRQSIACIFMIIFEKSYRLDGSGIQISLAIGFGDNVWSECLFFGVLSVHLVASMKLGKGEGKLLEKYGRSGKEKCRQKDRKHGEDMLDNFSALLEKEVANPDLRLWVIIIWELAKEVDGSLGVGIRATMVRMFLESTL
ncbi:hypothetical protein SUGI_0815540 [Cryptomeria japonica]|nr:hypothetical protein SUGI_0815540 [Cryptomeria japonica]